MDKPTFQWSDSLHFENTARKRIRETLGDEFVFEELSLICSSLYDLSNSLDLEENMNPTGAFISELKQAKTPQHYRQLIIKYVDIVNGKYEGYFRKGTLHLKGTKRQSFKDIFVGYLSNRKIKTVRDNENIPDLPGVYFLYDENKKLIYIGKATCLSTRVYSSCFERSAVFVRTMVTKTKADAHIFEPYLIAIHKPILNYEFKTDDKPTFVLDLPPLGDFFKISIIEE